jgi:D-apiose dehydrogenase
MTSNRKKIALVGLGAAAKTIHLPAYSKLANLELVGGHDPAITLAAGKGAFPFPVYEDVNTLLEQTKPDILAIASPTRFHYELAEQGLKYGCHIFCEKPFTTTLDEAHQLIALSEKQQRWIVVNNEFRFMNIYEAAKDKIGSPGFGDLLFINAQQSFYVNEKTEAGWRGNDPQRTCKEFGIHVLDLCRYFFGEEPLQISARMPKPSNPTGPDYLNLIQLDFSGGRSAQITLDRLTRGRHRYLDLRLDGSQASIETEFGGNVQFTAGIRGGDRKPFVGFDVSLGGRALQYHAENAKKIASDPLDIFANATSKLLKNFIDAIDNGGVPACSAQDNIKTLALMLAAYTSNDQGKPVPFAEHWS